MKITFRRHKLSPIASTPASPTPCWLPPPFPLLRLPLDLIVCIAERLPQRSLLALVLASRDLYHTCKRLLVPQHPMMLSHFRTIEKSYRELPPREGIAGILNGMQILCVDRQVTSEDVEMLDSSACRPTRLQTIIDQLQMPRDSSRQLNDALADQLLELQLYCSSSNMSNPFTQFTKLICLTSLTIWVTYSDVQLRFSTPLLELHTNVPQIQTLVIICEATPHVAYDASFVPFFAQSRFPALQHFGLCDRKPGIEYASTPYKYVWDPAELRALDTFLAAHRSTLFTLELPFWGHTPLVPGSESMNHVRLALSNTLSESRVSVLAGGCVGLLDILGSAHPAKNIHELRLYNVKLPHTVIVARPKRSSFLRSKRKPGLILRSSSSIQQLRPAREQWPCMPEVRILRLELHEDGVLPSYESLQLAEAYPELCELWIDGISSGMTNVDEAFVKQFRRLEWVSLRSTELHPKKGKIFVVTRIRVQRDAEGCVKGCERYEVKDSTFAWVSWENPSFDPLLKLKPVLAFPF